MLQQLSRKCSMPNCQSTLATLRFGGMYGCEWFSMHDHVSGICFSFYIEKNDVDFEWLILGRLHPGCKRLILDFWMNIYFQYMFYIFYVNVIPLFNALTDVFGLYTLAPTYMCVLGVSFLRKT